MTLFVFLLPWKLMSIPWTVGHVLIDFIRPPILLFIPSAARQRWLPEPSVRLPSAQCVSQITNFSCPSFLSQGPDRHVASSQVLQICCTPPTVSANSSVFFFPLKVGVGLTQAWMPTYVSILRIPQMISVWRATVEWYWQGKTEEMGGKPVPGLLCPPEITHGLTRARTRASAVRGRRLTTWATVRPWFCVTTIFVLRFVRRLFLKPLISKA
jgi:hypothetical protein